MYGFHNKILHIDVAQGSFKEESIDDKFIRNFWVVRG